MFGKFKEYDDILGIPYHETMKCKFDEYCKYVRWSDMKVE